jgi:hypothetical protein
MVEAALATSPEVMGALLSANQASRRRLIRSQRRQIFPFRDRREEKREECYSA